MTPPAGVQNAVRHPIARIELPGGIGPTDATTLLATADAVYVASGPMTSDSLWTVRRVDVGSGDVSGRQFRRPVSAMAVAGGLIWVGGNNRLSAVNAAVGRIVETSPVDNPGGGFGVIVGAPADGRQLWTATVARGGDPIRLQLRNPLSGEVVADTDLGNGVGVSSIAAGDDFAWVTISTGMMGAYRRVNYVHGRLQPVAPVSSDENPFTNSVMATITSGRLWLTDHMGSTIACADIRTGRVLARGVLPGLRSGPVGMPDGRLVVLAGSVIEVGRRVVARWLVGSSSSSCDTFGQQSGRRPTSAGSTD